MIFRKGYESGWSDELFKIKKRVLRHSPVCISEDLNQEALKGSFWDYELQKVRIHDDLFINKILRRRKKNGKLQYLVSWLGYPDSFNSWVDNLEDIEMSVHEYDAVDFDMKIKSGHWNASDS